MTDYIAIIGKYYPGTQASCIGDSTVYTNVVWTSSPIAQADLDAKALIDAQSNKNDEINQYRDQVFAGGFLDSNGIRWNASSTDISNINAVCTLIALGVVTSNQTWRDTSNTNHTLTPTQLVQLAGGMATFGQAAYANSWTHKANVAALTTITDVNNYNITTGWPT